MNEVQVNWWGLGKFRQSDSKLVSANTLEPRSKSRKPFLTTALLTYYAFTTRSDTGQSTLP